ncbi:hem oxygenasemulti-helical [Diaporthe amygdali]|uniref:hem oxygenasemulti-helical n=1 Tax=Phomopsis amygdali TaxID=1214568 RepID=UPI0022FEE240|nr:hem oxygenasemulti-helical [Diaporthe amygdali]KAJ0116031.1 hem oxygenasemulti-helical [Diaporthe amygdali]
MADNANISPDGESRSLANSINTAILSSHTKINRLILDRMPHAVPPQADNPSTYVSGLLHIGAVYIAFESLWQNILGIHTEIAPIPYTYPFHNNISTSSPNLSHEATPTEVTERLRQVLETAYWPNMLRTARVKADIAAMTGWPAHVVDDQLRSAGTTGALGTFLVHIKEVVDARPHLLLAYAYSLYLALLSGGSYIRMELMYLRAEFWLTVPEPIRPGMVPCTRELEGSGGSMRHSSSEYDSGQHGLAMEDPSVTLPLSFFDFDTPLGHENPRQKAKDLKAEFKRRFADAEQALTEPERRDVIAESVVVFQHLEAVVGQLDEICGGGAGIAQQGQSRRQAAKAVSPSSQQQPQPVGIGSRLRDSIDIAKARLLRTMRKSGRADGSVTATALSAPARGQPTTTRTFTDAYSPGLSGSSKMSSVSSSWVSESIQEDDPSSRLAHDAVVPGDGFRTIRYDDVDDDSKLDADGNVPRPGTEAYDGTVDDDGNSVGLRSQVCPVFRTPAVPTEKSAGTSAATTERARRKPDYALSTVVSNVTVLLGIAIAFAAYLYVRRRDGGTTTGFVGKD